VSPEERRQRLLGLAVVLIVALAPIASFSLQDYLATSPPPSPASAAHLGGITRSLSLIALVAYVLFREGGHIRQLGLELRRLDLLIAPALAALSLVPFTLIPNPEHPQLPPLTPLVDWTTTDLTPWGLIFDLVTSLKVAIASVAYLFTAVAALTGSGLAALLACGTQELATHRALPEALANAGRVSVMTLYYGRSRRAGPVALAMVLSSLWLLLHAAPR
jgi:hypothetical protein